MNCVEFIWFIRSAKKKTNWNILHVPLEESLARKPNYNMFSCGAFIDFKHKPWNEWKAHTNTSPSNWFRLFERTNLLWYCGALGTRHAARLNDKQVSLRWMVRHILRSIQSIPRSSHCELNTILFFFFFCISIVDNWMFNHTRMPSSFSRCDQSLWRSTRRSILYIKLV